MNECVIILAISPKKHNQLLVYRYFPLSQHTNRYHHLKKKTIDKYNNQQISHFRMKYTDIDVKIKEQKHTSYTIATVSLNGNKLNFSIYSQKILAPKMNNNPSDKINI